MKKVNFIFPIITAFIVFTYNIQAQTFINKRHYLSQKKIASLTSDGMGFSDGEKNLNICHEGTIKGLMTLKDGKIYFDVFQIKDSNICRYSEFINTNTKTPLILNFNRDKVGKTSYDIAFWYTQWTIGVQTFAIKIRPDVFDAVKDKLIESNSVVGTINGGPYIGFTIGRERFTHRRSTTWSFTPSIMCGISSIKLKDEPLSEKVDVTSNVGNIVLSPAFGFILSYNNIGISFARGWDYALGKNSEYWAYNQKPFYAIGISASLKL